MKQMLRSILMFLVISACATSLAFAGQNRKGKLGTGTTKRDRDCQSYQLNLEKLDNQLILAGNGNGNGGSGNGGNGPGDGTGNGGDGPADGSGNGAPDGAGTGGRGNGPGDGSCQG